MSESEIVSLVDEIENVDFREFWWDSPLLSRASSVRDPRVAQMLAFRHNCLTNSSAYSAHVVRQTIKHCDGPEFNSLWNLIDSESDTRAIGERMNDVDYLPWAAAFILGEIGGAHVFAATTARLTPAHEARFYLLIRLLSHVFTRYIQIEQAAEPTATVMDVKTGERKTVLLRDMGGNSYEMHLRKRAEADEYFRPLAASAITTAKRRLQAIPDSLFNIPKPQFLQALDIMQARNA